MRLAVLADVHGNLPALPAVLADVDRESGQAERGRARSALAGRVRRLA